MKITYPIPEPVQTHSKTHHNRWQFDKNGKLNGAYKLFFMSGLIAEENLYIKNEFEGERIDYTYDNGRQYLLYPSPYTDDDGK